VIVIVKDLAQPLSSKEIYEELHTQEIRVDILVNNAGFGDYGYFHEIDIEKEKQMIDLNVKALTELTYLFGRDMVKRGRGKILNVASTAAFQPGPLMSVYFATKHYVLAFSE
jgi:short-subunit dehydrogenase